MTVHSGETDAPELRPARVGTLVVARSTVRNVLTAAWLRELGLIVLLYLAYSSARVVASKDRAEAMHRAVELLSFERIFGFDIESRLNALLHSHPAMAAAAAFWYASTHYVVTPLVLIVLWRRFRPEYIRMRRVLAGSSAVALLGYLLFPTAPPRMLHGYVDVMATTSQVGWWGNSASAPRGLGGWTNELAAMPSMHVGWALCCTIAILSVARRLWLRALAVAYVVVTCVVVVATANHWIVDGLAGAAVVVAVLLVVHLVPARSAKPPPLAEPLEQTQPVA